jgi:hypothetical protein
MANFVLSEDESLDAMLREYARWILLHLIEETARHAGHADLIREALDGALSGPLMAAAEGWPADGWVKPWRPPS